MSIKSIEKFLRGWLVEGGPNDSLAPAKVVHLWKLSTYSGWAAMQALDSAVEDWAIELGISTTPVDDAHPDAPWGDNLVRKLMIIRGTVRG